MRTWNIIFWGISGTLIAGLTAFIVSIKIDNPVILLPVLLMFIAAPALSCVAGGLKDYRIAAMVGVYTLIGVVFFSMVRPAVAISPSGRELYRAKRVLSGDIGAGHAVLGGCSLAIGRIVFIRKKKPSTISSNETE